MTKIFTSLPSTHTPVQGTVQVPASKSIMNRALILSATATAPSTILNGLESRDSRLMLQALTNLGCKFSGALSQELICQPHTPLKAADIDVGLSGTVLRFIVALSGLVDGKVTFRGDPHMSKRPIRPMLEALTHLGLNLDAMELPFSVDGYGHIPGGQVELDASASSQFISGLLLSGAKYDTGVHITHRGKKPPSQPHIDMTISMLSSVGVMVEAEHNATQKIYSWKIHPGDILPQRWVVEPDLSNASVFFAAALATGGQISIPGWSLNQWQPKETIKEIFELLGGSWEETPSKYHSSETTITVTGEELKGIDVDLHDVSELTPTIAALATLASEPSILRGIGHIRGHETNRLQALCAEINKIGGKCIETDDGLQIFPQPLHGGTWKSYADHRMVTAAAIVALRTPDLSVDDIATTSKTMPEFQSMWESIIR